MRVVLRRAVERRLLQVLDADNRAALFKRGAMREARALRDLLRDGDGDVQTRLVLGNFHMLRYSAREGRDRSDLDTAVAMFIYCLVAGADLRGMPEQWRTVVAHELTLRATPILLRAQESLDPSLVAQAVELWRSAVAVAPDDYIDRAVCLLNLGAALRVRWDLNGVAEDLNEAIRVGREAVAATPDHPNTVQLSNLGKALTNLSGALHARFERDGAFEDLDEAIRVSREAVATAPDHTEQARPLCDLGTWLLARADRTGTRADIDDCVAVCRQAAATADAATDVKIVALNNLGHALRLRARWVGGPADLDEAIDIHRRVVAMISADHPQRGHLLSNLGVALRRRFERAGARADLDEAITIHHAAVAATSADDPERAGWLSNLGAALHVRFGRVGARGDLDDAVDIHRQAVAATSAGHRDRARRLTNLANVLRIRFQLDGRDGTDLNEAIDIYRQVVEITPADDPEQAMWLSNLGLALRVRFAWAETPEDLDEAVAASRSAASATPAGTLAGAEASLNLGFALRDRFERTGTRADQDEAIDVLEQVLNAELVPPSMRVQAAHAAGRLAARSQPSRAAALLERAVRLLPEVAPRALERDDQQHALAGFAGLAGEAAALTLDDPDKDEDERAERALQLLEAGRAVLLGQALEVRGDLSDLSDRHPDLTEQFIRLRDLLDQPSDSSTDPTDSPGQATEHRRRLTRELTDVLTQIRSLEGFTSFALPPSIADLRSQAASGPVVVINVSRYRSDALLLTTDAITCLPLTGLSIDAIAHQANAFHEALETAHHSRRISDRKAAQRQLRKVLTWLWDHVAAPVLKALGHHTAPTAGHQWPRIWWIPCGPLALLPIHAAGHHTDPPDPHACTVMDRVISSYTPTISALRHARRRTSKPANGQALIVAMPTTPGVAGRLDHALHEAQLVAARLPDSITLIEPDGGPRNPAEVAATATIPTRESVLNLLARCQIAHFACHGTSDPANPSRSHLLLHDHNTAPLTVTTLTPIHLDNAQLAYLSACDTAKNTSPELIDEAIHLASACQLAGYPHVIGTLWTINDHVAALIADTFYKHLTADTENDTRVDVHRAAEALHHAVRAVRATRPTTPSLWAAHLHTGA